METKSDRDRKRTRKYDSLRGAAMVIEHLAGKSIADIAKAYEVTIGEVHRTLDGAQEAGWVEHFRSLGYDKLMSKALAVYEARLDMGDIDAARDIAFGLGVLKKETKEAKIKEKAITTLDEYRATRTEPEDKKEKVN